MSSLSYVGAAPQDSPDIVNRRQATTIINSAPVNRTGVSSQIHTTATTTYASKTYIDTQDATFALPSYYQSRDDLNVPNTAKGQANGVASLDSSGKIPLAQMPVLGAGYLLGPYGTTTAPVQRVAGQSPLDIVHFNIGVHGYHFQPLVFATVLATPTSGGRTVIEARISDGQAPYVSQTLVARGIARNLFDDVQSIAVIPCAATAGQTPTSFPDTMNIWVSLWVYDLYQSSTVTATGIVSASVYLLRTSL